MKIQLTFEFDDRERRALATHYGQTGKLSRREIVLWLEGLVRSTLEAIVSEAE